MNYRNDKGLICMDLWSNNDIKEGNQVIKYNDNVLIPLITCTTIYMFNII